MNPPGGEWPYPGTPGGAAVPWSEGQERNGNAMVRF